MTLVGRLSVPRTNTGFTWTRGQVYIHTGSLSHTHIYAYNIYMYTYIYIYTHSCLLSIEEEHDRLLAHSWEEKCGRASNPFLPP